jgi:hypothetical protein
VIYEVSRFGLDLLDDAGDDLVPLHLLPLGLKGMLRAEALPDRPLVIAMALDEGAWTLRVNPAPATGHPLTWVSVTPEAAPDADVTVRGSAMALLARRRGTGEAGVAPPVFDGADDDVATVEALFSPPRPRPDGVASGYASVDPGVGITASSAATRSSASAQ